MPLSPKENERWNAYEMGSGEYTPLEHFEFLMGNSLHTPYRLAKSHS